MGLEFTEGELEKRVKIIENVKLSDQEIIFLALGKILRNENKDGKKKRF
jgi:hypothetical protein